MSAFTVGMPLADYLAIPALSSGVIRAMATDCQRAAWHLSHLNPEPPEADDNDGSDRGSIGHEIFLERSENCVAVIDPKDYPAKTTGAIPEGWTNQAIRAARDQARAAGKVPVLASAMTEIREMVRALYGYVDSLRESEPAIWRAFQPDGGFSEATILWNDGGINCKARPDRISADHSIVIHLKTTAGSANPGAWARTHLYAGDEHYLTAAWYRRACLESFGVDASQVFLICPQKEPYLPSLLGVPPAAMDMGDADVDAALKDWRACLKRNRWDGYPSRCLYVDPPVWMEMRREERETLSVEERLLLGSQA